jgi:hypothetical protein
MKIAVLISGQMRTANVCVQSIRNIYPNANFIVHAVADKNSDKAFLFKPAVTVIEPQYEMPERREYSIQIGRGCHGVQRVLKQLWGLKRVWEIFEQSGISADFIVRCRPDLLFSRNPENIDNNTNSPGIYIPKFANWCGLNDRFAYGDVNSMKTYFLRLNYLDVYIDQQGIFHPETFLEWSVREYPIYRTNAVFASLREDGSRDEPIWKKETKDILN